MGYSPAEYLATLAMVAATFVVFATVFVTFRQALGGPVSRYDVLATRTILFYAVVVILGALAPLLLALFGVSSAVGGRAASLGAAIPTLIYNARFPAWRSAATDRPVPKRVWVDVAAVYLAAGVLGANALGRPVPPGPAVHALGLTMLLAATFLAFLFGLDLLPGERWRSIDERAGPDETARTDGGG